MLVGELHDLLAPVTDRAQRSIEHTTENAVVVSRVAHVPEIHPMVAAVVGDIVHNLRSALDHLAWQLVIFDGGTPRSGPGRTQFPILESKPKRALDITPGIGSVEILERVERMQPYCEAVHGHDPATDSLGIIARLDNIDKHRLLLTVVHGLNRGLVLHYGANTDDPKPQLTLNAAPLQSGDWVARSDFGDAIPPAHYRPTVELVVTVADPEANWGSGTDLVDLMDGLRQAVIREIKLHIEPLFGDIELLSWS